MIDISTVGARIEIKFQGGGTLTITEFSDEGTPFAGGNVDVSTNQKNLNGQMISSRTPAVYQVSLTVIPGSDADAYLSDKLMSASIMPGSITPISALKVESLIIAAPAIDGSGGNAASFSKFIYKNGRMKSGPVGPTSSAQGRMGSRTFNFEFEKYDHEGSGQNVNS